VRIAKEGEEEPLAQIKVLGLAMIDGDDRRVRRIHVDEARITTCRTPAAAAASIAAGAAGGCQPACRISRSLSAPATWARRLGPVERRVDLATGGGRSVSLAGCG
jgi:hypothetical protein